MDARQDVQREVRRLVKYLWKSEEQHYWECEPSGRRRHIFKSLRFLNQKFNCGMKEDPDYQEN